MFGRCKMWTIHQFLSFLTSNSECDIYWATLRDDMWIICRITDSNLTNVYTSIKHVHIWEANYCGTLNVIKGGWHGHSPPLGSGSNSKRNARLKQKWSFFHKRWMYMYYFLCMPKNGAAHTFSATSPPLAHFHRRLGIFKVK